MRPRPELRFLLWLAWRDVRAWPPARTILALAALALGVGLVAATGTLGAALRATLARPALAPGRTADLWLASAYDVDYLIPAALAGQVAALDGVAGVEPVLHRPTQVQTPGSGRTRSDSLVVAGIEPASYLAFHEMELAAGRLPATDEPGLIAPAPWALVHELSLGQPITLTTLAGPLVLPLTGLIDIQSLATAEQGWLLYAPLPTVQRWFENQDQVTALEVRLATGASARRVQRAIEQAMGPAYVVSTAAHPERGLQVWQRLVLGGLAAASALSLAGSAALVYGVWAAAAQGRRRQVSLLRVAGARRRDVLGLLLAQATQLGLIGSGLGLGLGLAFGRLGQALVFEDSAPPAGSRLPAAALVLAVGAGLAASIFGAVGPALRAARLPPLAGLLPLGQAPSRRQDRAAAWLVGLFSGRLAAGKAGLAVTSLAYTGVARQPRRAAVIVASLALILAMGLGSAGILSIVGGELDAATTRLSGADYLVLPALTSISFRELAGQDTSDVPPLDAGLLGALDALGASVRLMRGTTTDVPELQVLPGQPTVLLDVEGYAYLGGFRFQAGDWPSALAAFRRGPAVLLAPAVARRLGVEPGGVISLHTTRGPVDFTVAGIGDAELAACVLDLADGAVYLGADEISAVAVQLSPEANADIAREALVDAVQVHGGTLLPIDQLSARLRAMVRQARLALGLLVAAAGAVALLGVVNAVLSSMAERRREIGLLRAAGATRRQVTRLILIEMAGLGLLAALAGIALGWLVTGLFAAVARSILGLGAAPGAALLLGSAAALVAWPALAMLAGLGPALGAARLAVVDAILDSPHRS